MFTSNLISHTAICIPVCYSDYWVRFPKNDMATFIKPGSLHSACLHDRIITFDEHQLRLIIMATMFPPTKDFKYRPLRTPSVCGWFHAPDAMIVLLSNGYMQMFFPDPCYSLVVNDEALTLIASDNNRFTTIEFGKINNISEEMFILITSAKFAMASFLRETQK